MAGRREQGNLNVLRDVPEGGPLDTAATGPGPSPRGYHTANVVHDTMVVMGGSNGASCYNDIWLFNLRESFQTREKTFRC
jgi:hypothetical protein